MEGGLELATMEGGLELATGVVRIFDFMSQGSPEEDLTHLK
jgi:hypothetical protein